YVADERSRICIVDGVGFDFETEYKVIDHVIRRIAGVDVRNLRLIDGDRTVAAGRQTTGRSQHKSGEIVLRQCGREVYCAAAVDRHATRRDVNQLTERDRDGRIQRDIGGIVGRDGRGN